MANTLELISSVTVGSGGASTIAFSSIPSTFTDLYLQISARNSSGGENTSIAINGSTSGFSLRGLGGDGSSVFAYSRSDNLNVFLADGSGNTANTFSSVSIYFPNYAGSTNKSYSIESLTENNATGATATLQAGLWSNTAAINAFTFSAGNGSGVFAQYTTAYLYGISNS
jgi:hypothetical protein